MLDFRPPVLYPVGKRPLGVALGHFRGDDRPLDAVIANNGSGDVSVLLGNGDTTFQPARSFPTGGSPYGVAVGDFRGIGKLDLVTANNDNDTVSVLLGNGDGTFQPPRNFGVGLTPLSVAVGDFNNDGIPDLVTAGNRSNTLSVLLGNGDGTFQAPRVFPACGIIDHADGFNRHDDLQSNGSAQFTKGAGRLTDDFSQAGSFFTLVRNGVGFFNTSFTLRFHEGTQPNPADGITFTIQTNSPTALGGGGGGLGYQGIPNSVAIKFDIFNNEGETDNSTGLFFDGDYPGLPHAPGEVNVPIDPRVINLRDQNPKQVDLSYVGSMLTETIIDLVTRQFFTTSYVVDIPARVGSNTAYAGFTGGTSGLYAIQDVQTWRFASLSGPVSVAVGDFNNDGNLDAAVACNGFFPSNDTVSVLLGNGDGTLRPPLNFEVGSDPQSVAAADFNGDGFLDLVTANSGSDNVSVLLGDGDGTFRTAVNYDVGSRPRSVAVGRIDLNGHPPDIVTANANFGNDTLSVLLGNGDGTFQSVRNFSAGLIPFSVVLGDLGQPAGPKGGWQSGVATGSNGDVPGDASGTGNDCSWSPPSSRSRTAPDGDARTLALAGSVNISTGGSGAGAIQHFTDSIGAARPDPLIPRFANSPTVADKVRGDLDLFFIRSSFAHRTVERDSGWFLDSANYAILNEERDLLQGP